MGNSKRKKMDKVPTNHLTNSHIVLNEGRSHEFTRDKEKKICRNDLYISQLLEIFPDCEIGLLLDTLKACNNNIEKSIDTIFHILQTGETLYLKKSDGQTPVNYNYIADIHKSITSTTNTYTQTNVSKSKSPFIDESVPKGCIISSKDIDYQERHASRSRLYVEAVSTFRGSGCDAQGSPANSFTRKASGMFKMRELSEYVRDSISSEYNLGKSEVKAITQILKDSHGTKTVTLHNRWDKNHPYTVDVHGKTINEALSFASGALEEFMSSRAFPNHNKEIKIITGLGLHSSNGKSRIDKELVKKLRNDGYNVSIDRACIYVSI